jgi:hypothetical protein
MILNKLILFVLGFVIPMFFAAECDSAGECDRLVSEASVDLSTFVLKDTLRETTGKAPWALFPDPKDSSIWIVRTTQAQGVIEFKFKVDWSNLTTIDEKFLGAK